MSDPDQVTVPYRKVTWSSQDLFADPPYALGDTVWVYGGEHVANEGRFEDDDGYPDPQGWTGVDLSGEGVGQFAQVWPYLDTFGMGSKTLSPSSPGQRGWIT